MDEPTTVRQEVTLIGIGRNRTAVVDCPFCQRRVTFAHDWSAQSACTHQITLDLQFGAAFAVFRRG